MPNLNRHPAADKPRISVGLVRVATHFHQLAGVAQIHI
jgi:hypothetical protein